MNQYHGPLESSFAGQPGALVVSWVETLRIWILFRKGGTGIILFADTSQYTRVRKSIVQNGIFDGGEHEANVRRVGSLRKTDKKGTPWISLGFGQHVGFLKVAATGGRVRNRRVTLTEGTNSSGPD